MNTSAFAAVFKRFGTIALLHDLLISTISKLFFFRVLFIYVLDGSAALAAIPEDVDIHLMSLAALLKFKDRKEYELPESFLNEAFKNGDQCFGAFINNELAGYAWYALKDSTSSRNLTTSFSPHYVYAYKNLTLEEYKGRGIQKWIKTFTFNFYRKMDKTGIVVAIESQNFSSRRSTAGTGAKIIGFWPYVLKNGRYLGFGTLGCKRIGYRLKSAATNDN
jgi:hypothetical protein